MPAPAPERKAVMTGIGCEPESVAVIACTGRICDECGLPTFIVETAARMRLEACGSILRPIH